MLTGLARLLAHLSLMLKQPLASFCDLETAHAIIDPASIEEPRTTEDFINRTLVQQLFSVLDPTEQELITLAVLQGVEQRDVCALLELSPGTYKKILRVAKKKMRKYLESSPRLMSKCAGVLWYNEEFEDD